MCCATNVLSTLPASLLVDPFLSLSNRGGGGEGAIHHLGNPSYCKIIYLNIFIAAK